MFDDLPHFGDRRGHGNGPLRPCQLGGLLPLLPPGLVLRAEMGGSRRDTRCFCSPQAGLTQCQQVRQRHGGIGGDGQVDSLETLIVGGPTAHQKIAHGDMDDLRLRADSRLEHPGGFIDSCPRRRTDPGRPAPRRHRHWPVRHWQHQWRQGHAYWEN